MCNFILLKTATEQTLIEKGNLLKTRHNPCIYSVLNLECIKQVWLMVWWYAIDPESKCLLWWLPPSLFRDLLQSSAAGANSESLPGTNTFYEVRLLLAPSEANPLVSKCLSSFYCVCFDVIRFFYWINKYSFIFYSQQCFHTECKWIWLISLPLKIHCTLTPCAGNTPVKVDYIEWQHWCFGGSYPRC